MRPVVGLTAGAMGGGDHAQKLVVKSRLGVRKGRWKYSSGGVLDSAMIRLRQRQRRTSDKAADERRDELARRILRAPPITRNQLKLGKSRARTCPTI